MFQSRLRSVTQDCIVVAINVASLVGHCQTHYRRYCHQLWSSASPWLS